MASGLHFNLSAHWNRRHKKIKLVLCSQVEILGFNIYVTGLCTKLAFSLAHKEIYSWKKISGYIKKDGNAPTLKDLQLICSEQKTSLWLVTEERIYKQSSSSQDNVVVSNMPQWIQRLKRKNIYWTYIWVETSNQLAKVKLYWLPKCLRYSFANSLTFQLVSNSFPLDDSTRCFPNHLNTNIRGSFLLHIWGKCIIK